MPKFANNFISPHVHIQSLDSVSLLSNFVKREQELSTGAITITDHGLLGGCSDVYDAAKKAKLIPILGLEAYVRDDDCPILKKHGIAKDEKGTFSSYLKYLHLTIHAKNEVAYKALSKKLSWAHLNRVERHGVEAKPLFNWADLEELSSHDFTMCSSCLIGMVSRHIMAGRPEIARDYYERVRSLVKPGDFYVEVFPHKCTHFWDSGVYLHTDKDGVKDKLKFRIAKKLKLETAGAGSIELSAQDLSRTFKTLGEVKLIATKHYQQWTDIDPVVVTSVEFVEGFMENECAPWMSNSDMQKPCNEFALKLAQEYGDKIIISDDSHMPYPEDKPVQDMKLTASGGNWKFANSYHRMGTDEAAATLQETLKVDNKTIEEWVDNSFEFRDKFKDFKFNDVVDLPRSRYPADTLRHAKTLIDKHGRMDWGDPAMVARLKQELKLFKDNGTIDLLPYFFLAEEAISHSRYGMGELPGPGRGSSAGTITDYLLGITHVDPLEIGLSLDRFITLDRIKSGKMPDIDMDFPVRDTMLDPEKGWVFKTFGDCAAAISTRTGLRLRSCIKDAARSKLGYVPPEVDHLVSKFPIPPQGVVDSDWLRGYVGEDGHEVRGYWDENADLRQWASTNPEIWDVVERALGTHRGMSRHASAVLIMDKPIADSMPIMDVGGVRTTQYTMGGVEARGGLKMDFLGVETLGILQDAIRLVQDTNGGRVEAVMKIGKIKALPQEIIPHQGQHLYIWKLPEEQPVFHEICAGNTETVFQLNTSGAIKWLREFNHWKDESKNLKSLSSVMDLSTFTALARPGPLDAEVVDEVTGDKFNMLQEYARRARGEPAIGEVPALTQLLPETYGILVYQEGLEKVYRYLTDCDGSEATEFRSNIAKKKLEKVQKAFPMFMERASAKIGAEQSQQVWDQIVTFGRYGFNMSHSYCYMLIAYACAWLKHHYPLQWWCAVLRHTKKEKLQDLWKFCQKFVLQPDIQKSGDDFVIEGSNIRAPISFLDGIGEKAHQELIKGRPYANLLDFCEKIEGHKISGTKILENGKSRKGTSALNIGAVGNLVLAGMLDGFFEPGLSLAEKLFEYHKTIMKLQGKRTIPKIKSKLVNYTPLECYQARKRVLSMDGSMVVPFLDMSQYTIRQHSPGLYVMQQAPWKTSDSMVLVAEGQALFNVLNNPVSSDEQMTVGTFAYVIADRRFSYKNGSKTAADILFDTAGFRANAVMWPKADRVSLPLPDLTGAVVYVTLLKRAGKPPVIGGLHLIKEPLKKEKADKDDSK